MKKIVIIGLVVPILVVVGAGCESALTHVVSPTSWPVTTGLAGTNLTSAVAWETAAGHVAQTVAPPGYSGLVGTIFGAVIALTSGVSGWLARHKATQVKN